MTIAVTGATGQLGRLAIAALKARCSAAAEFAARGAGICSKMNHPHLDRERLLRAA